MKKLDLLRAVMRGMEPRMLDYQFKMSFAKQKFIKQKDRDFLIAYSLSVTERFNMMENRSGIVIEPAVYVNNNLVERIYARITMRKIDFVTDLKTIGNVLAELIANPTGVYKIRNQSLSIFNYSEEDIPVSAKKIVAYFEDFVIPYFERYATWRGIDEIFNSDLLDNTVHCNIEPERSLRGLIVAKLIGRHDIDQLMLIHSKRIENLGNENYKIELERLLNIFDTIKPIEV